MKRFKYIERIKQEFMVYEELRTYSGSNVEHEFNDIKGYLKKANVGYAALYPTGKGFSRHTEREITKLVAMSFVKAEIKRKSNSLLNEVNTSIAEEDVSRFLKGINIDERVIKQCIDKILNKKFREPVR
jgi:DNA repair exonuclease SbcCD nuclease subunit